jgi:hypothetical protein
MKSNMKPYTSKQFGDAGEMLVAAELTLAGIPALKVPDNWPGSDVIATLPDGTLQRVSVKTRVWKRGSSHWVGYSRRDAFDWLAIVLIDCPGSRRRLFVLPRAAADRESRQDSPTAKTNDCYWRIDEVEQRLARYEGNFALAADLPD